MLTPDRWIRIGSRRLLGREVIGALLGPLAAAIWSWAALLLAVKLWWPAAIPVALWSGSALLAGACARGVAQRRPAVTRSAAAVWLDRELEAGGLVIALAERPDDRWAALLPQQHQRWRDSLPRWPWAAIAHSLAWPLAFLAGTLIIPARESVAAAAVETTLGQETARELADMVNALDAMPLFEPSEKARLKGEIAALAEEVRRAPLTHQKWETVDALRQRLQARVGLAGSELGQAGQILSLLSAAMDGGAANLSIEQQRQLEQQALGIVRKFATADNVSRFQNLVEEPAVRILLQQGTTALPTDPGERKELLRGLQQAVSGEARDLAALQNLLPAGELSKSLAAAAMGGALSSLLGGVSPVPGLAGRQTSEQPNFGDAGQRSAERFQPQRAGAVPSTPAPASRVPSPAASPGDVTAGARPTGEAWTRQVSPRHRAAVRQYFGAASPQN